MKALEILNAFDNDTWLQSRNFGDGRTDLDTWFPNFVFDHVKQDIAPDYKPGMEIDSAQFEVLRKEVCNTQDEVLRLMWDRNDNKRSDRHIVYLVLLEYSGQYLIDTFGDEAGNEMHWDMMERDGFNGYNGFVKTTGKADLTYDEIKAYLFPAA